MKKIALIGAFITALVMNASALMTTVGIVKDIAGNSINVEGLLDDGYSILILQENTW